MQWIHLVYIKYDISKQTNVFNDANNWYDSIPNLMKIQSLCLQITTKLNNSKLKQQNFYWIPITKFKLNCLALSYSSNIHSLSSYYSNIDNDIDNDIDLLDNCSTIKLFLLFYFLNFLDEIIFTFELFKNL
jgi:hypothetical protein